MEGQDRSGRVPTKGSLHAKGSEHLSTTYTIWPQPSRPTSLDAQELPKGSSLYLQQGGSSCIFMEFSISINLSFFPGLLSPRARKVYDSLIWITPWGLKKKDPSPRISQSIRTKIFSCQEEVTFALHPYTISRLSSWFLLLPHKEYCHWIMSPQKDMLKS